MTQKTNPPSYSANVIPITRKAKSTESADQQAGIFLSRSLELVMQGAGTAMTIQLTPPQAIEFAIHLMATAGEFMKAQGEAQACRPN